VMEGLLTLLLSEQLGLEVSGARPREPNPQADQLRAQIRDGLNAVAERVIGVLSCQYGQSTDLCSRND
jgi:hypothetical protein